MDQSKILQKFQNKEETSLKLYGKSVKKRFLI